MADVESVTRYRERLAAILFNFEVDDWGNYQRDG
jgi:hypothetical protein